MALHPILFPNEGSCLHKSHSYKLDLDQHYQSDYFWKVAKTTPYYDELKKQLADFTDEDRQRARDDLKKMADKVKSIEKEIFDRLY